MKNSSNFNIKNGLTVSLLASALFFFASCEKDVIPAPSGINVSGNTEKATASNSASQAEHFQSDAASQSVHKSFDMIVINHIAARTSAPDYIVTVRGDGYVTFEGRRNVSLIGKKVWKLEAPRFTELQNLFIESEFTEIDDTLSLYVNVPIIYTSFTASASSRPVTLFDYNQGYPQALINIRIIAEGILDISQYVAQMDVEAAGDAVTK
ncbi:MAG: DUF6438 domain-containing protein [Bacteroidia bacterium]